MCACLWQVLLIIGVLLLVSSSYYTFAASVDHAPVNVAEAPLAEVDEHKDSVVQATAYVVLAPGTLHHIHLLFNVHIFVVYKVSFVNTFELLVVQWKRR